jgi:hypothetical protein
MNPLHRNWHVKITVNDTVFNAGTVTAASEYHAKDVVQLMYAEHNLRLEDIQVIEIKYFKPRKKRA